MEQENHNSNSNYESQSSNMRARVVKHSKKSANRSLNIVLDKIGNTNVKLIVMSLLWRYWS